MRISDIAGSTVGRLTRRVATADSLEPGAESRALIAVEPPAPSERSFVHSRHPAAPFLAHLIATHMRAPQTCARRRVEPGEAISAYAAVAAKRG